MATPDPTDGTILADLEEWRKRFKLAYGSSRQYYLWSPEYEGFWDGVWRDFDELEGRRRQASADEPDWFPRVKQYRQWQRSSRAESFVPTEGKNWDYCPLWVHVDRWTSSYTSERTMFPWAAAAASWDKFLQLCDEDAEFLDSLSPSQLSSAQVLNEWMACSYSVPELVEKVQQFIHDQQDVLSWGGITTRKLLKETLEGGMADLSLYHCYCIELFFEEFHPYSWEPFEGHKSLINRQQKRFFASRRAVIQRMSYAVRVFYEGNQLPVPDAPDPPYPRTGVHKEPWHDPAGANPQEHPYYLWDVSGRKTIRVHDLPSCPAYTCISHTWGRWRVTTATSLQHGSSCWQASGEASVQDLSGHWKVGHSAAIEGVPWPVPQVTLYDVCQLPDMLSGLGADFVWLDLFCIPQDGSPLAGIEIARQSAIFRGADRCVAWLHDAGSWDGISRALDWVGLIYLDTTSRDNIYDISDEMLGQVIDSADGPTELMTGHLEGSERVGTWLSSLWTLQEAVMRPDMELFSRDWHRLEDRRGGAITLETLIVVCDPEVSWTLIHPDILPQSPMSDLVKYHREALEIYGYGEGLPIIPRGALALSSFGRKSQSLRFSMEACDPAAIFACSSGRVCTDSRAPGIMSALEVTDWYEQRSQHGDGGEALVLGVFPIEFIRETFAKYGVRLLRGVWMNVRWLSESDVAREHTPPQARGTVLPFSGLDASKHKQRSFIPTGNVLFDATPHEAVEAWCFLPDGSMQMTRAGILMSTAADSTLDAVSACLRWSRPQDGGREDVVVDEHEPTVPDLLLHLREHTPANHIVFAVALFQHGRRQTGMVLQTPKGCYSDGTTTYLVKVGDYCTNEVSGIQLPRCTPVDWVIL